MSNTTIWKIGIFFISILAFLGTSATNLIAQTSPTLPITFEDTANIDYAPAPFGSATVAIIANPDATGDNTTAFVLNIGKPMGAADFAGISMDLSAAIDPANGNRFTMKVWSPRAGVTFRFKA
ncbi:MAG: hypothetical protein AAF696_38310, partial [Bacteroidota bacterium]